MTIVLLQLQKWKENDEIFIIFSSSKLEVACEKEFLKEQKKMNLKSF